MKRFKHLCIAALGSATLAFGAPSAATPVTVGSPVTYNFRSPTPGPFTTYQIEFDIAYCSVFEAQTASGCHGTNAPDAGTVTLFDGLNATGTSRQYNQWSDTGYFNGFGGPTTGLNAVFADGMFSLVYTASLGAIEVGSPFAYFTNAAGAVRVDGVLVSAVPEPEPIVLLGLGSLAAVGVARRRRRPAAD